MQTTRTSLLSAIKDPENAKAWGELYDRYAPFVRNLVRGSQTGLRDDEVESVVLVILLELAQGKLNYKKGAGNFRSLLAVAARHRAIDQVRKRDNIEEHKVQPVAGDTRVTDVIERRPDEQVGVDELIESEWRQVILKRARRETRKQVSLKQYQIFEATVLKDWPTTRTMETLGVTANQVYNATSRVGRIFDEQCRIAAVDIDDPDLPVTELEVS